ncbi:hypothetical protein J6590_081665 [Homalodisca vitripennis]|nr:hypothetical protein J6590_081665 [Homalodisca vitripennis]
MAGVSHCRCLATLMQDMSTSHIEIYNPDAGILDNAPSLSSSPSKEHATWLQRGGASSSGTWRESFINVRDKKRALILIALSPDSPIHDSIVMVNNFISELCLGRHHFTAHGQHFNGTDKRLLASAIVKTLTRPSSPLGRHCSVVPIPATDPRPSSMHLKSYAEVVTKGSPCKDTPTTIQQAAFIRNRLYTTDNFLLFPKIDLTS